MCVVWVCKAVTLKIDATGKKYASSCLTTLQEEKKKTNSTGLGFSNFYGINTPAVVDFKLPTSIPLNFALRRDVIVSNELSKPPQLEVGEQI